MASNPCDKSIFFMPTNCVEILNIVNSLKISYSCSHDKRSTHFFKQIAESIVTPLVHICNLSLTIGVFPDSLKKAKVIPIYTKDDSYLVSNYLPVSILPTISKVLERLIYNRLIIVWFSNKKWTVVWKSIWFLKMSFNRVSIVTIIW